MDYYGLLYFRKNDSPIPSVYGIFTYIYLTDQPFMDR